MSFAEGTRDSHSRHAGLRSAQAPARDPLISGSGDSCAACWACVRACPARAVRVADNHSEIIADRCVMCGACVLACGRRGHAVRDDLPAALKLLSGERPVVAVLATEFLAALHPMTPPEVEQALFAAGFYSVETTLLGEELVALEYERVHEHSSMPTMLRSTCPVAVQWVRHFHPSLTGSLAPIAPPYIVQARLVRRLYPEDVAIVYISPCFARKEEVFEAQFAGEVDVAIDFTELRRLLEPLRPPISAHPGRAEAETPGHGGGRQVPVKQISLTDGFPRRTLAGLDMTSREVVTVRGIGAIDVLLTALSRGESGPDVVDMLACDGCLDGPAVGSDLSVYAKRSLVAKAAESSGRLTIDTRALLAHLPEVEVARSFTPRPAKARVFSEEEVNACLAEGEFFTADDHLDCGGCGYDTCAEHAKAVLGRDSTWGMCFPLQRKILERNHAALLESATLDSLTRLWNREVFSERLESEVARFVRYGTPVTLLMIDLDDFKAVNDTHGHVAGDAVLVRVSELLREAVRETDIPARYGGDEFALILPGVGKTAGWAVAEKIRGLVSMSAVAVPGSVTGATVSMTLSVGLASASQTLRSGMELLEAADRALYRAKARGRDQVRIAPD